MKPRIFTGLLAVAAWALAPGPIARGRSDDAARCLANNCSKLSTHQRRLIFRGSAKW
jgi:hypothetical protein